MNATDATIAATLTTWPRYVPEWGEYACRSDLTGHVYYGATADEARARMVEDDERAAKTLARN